MIIVKDASDADITITFSRGVFTVRGKIGNNFPINFRLGTITAGKVYIEGVAQVHQKETGYALKVFDMSERVYP